jgi:hypothetical protein
MEIKLPSRDRIVSKSKDIIEEVNTVDIVTA